MKRVLVTGGAGFIGSHLCERLLGSGDYVICLDNFYTGREKNIRHLSGKRNFRVIEHDVTKKIFLECDEIYNLACPASPVYYQSEPVRTVTTSVEGAVNILELAKKAGARVLQASTSEVYGDPDIHPQHENYHGNVNITGPRACYDEGKRCAETIFFSYHRQEKVRIKIVRIFNTYGPRMRSDDGRVISNFIVQALKGSNITIYGDGSQTRSFQYIDDLINGLILMMESPDEFTGPVNLGNPQEISIAELAQEVITLTGSRSKVIFKPLPEDDPKQRQPDISLAKAVLQWEPSVNLKPGLKKTIEYFRKDINH